MKHLAAGLVNLRDVPAQTSPRGTTRKVIAREERTGASTVLLAWPGGFRASAGTPSQFEYHTLHEEIFVTKGRLAFDHWYAVDALSYLNHPPYWVHPTVQIAETPIELFLKINKPVDFEFVDIPRGWSGQEFYPPDAPRLSASRAITRLRPDDLPWQPLLTSSGEPTGVDARRLWDDEDDGWTTWMMRVPPGWQGSGPKREVRGAGDDMLVVSGDLTLDLGDGPKALSAESYYCTPNQLIDGGLAEGSDKGCLAIRWTREATHLRIPPLSF